MSGIMIFLAGSSFCLFILEIDKQHELSWLCFKDPYKKVQRSEGFFSSFLSKRLHNFPDMEINKFIIFSLKLKEIV